MARAFPLPPPTAGDDCGRASKRRRCQEDGAEQPVQIHDWISELPDDILVHILSLLPIREAAMTACLSTRWRHLWKMSPVLALDSNSVLAPHISDGTNSIERNDPKFWDARGRKFTQKVNEILRHHRGTGIETFSVSFPLSSTHASHLDRWVEYAAASGAKEVVFFLSGQSKAEEQPEKSYNFPSQYFVGRGGSPLRQLFLCNCSIVAPSDFRIFVSLKHLALNNVSVGDVGVSDVLSGCSALTHLMLRHCHQLVNLKTSHSQLHHMVVSGCKNLKSIVIDAKNLAMFEYHGHKLDVKYDSAPVLFQVIIVFLKETACPLDCITALPKLRKLLLQFYSPLEVPRVRQHAQLFAGLTHVVLLLTTSWNQSIRSIAYLLRAAPLVKKLQIEAYSDLQPLKELNIRWPRKVSLKRLRDITVGGFSGESELMELLFFLLPKAPALKTLSIDTHRRYYQQTNKWKREENEDAIRCYYARGVALTELSPRVPSTVKLLIK